MTLRKQLALLLGGLVFLTLAATAVVSQAVLSRSYRARADQQLADDMLGLERGLAEELATRHRRLLAAMGGAGTIGPATAVGRTPLTATLAALTGGTIERDRVSELAARVGAEHGLDYLEILDGNGEVLSSRSWPASYGRSAPELRGWTDEGRGRPTTRWVWVRGEPNPNLEHPALVRGERLSLGGSTYEIVTGVILDPADLARRSALLGATIGICADGRWLWAQVPNRSAFDAARSRELRPASGVQVIRRGNQATRVWLARTPAAQHDRCIVNVWLAVARPEAPLAAALADLRNSLGLITIVAVAIAVLIAAIAARRLASPLEGAARAAERVASGQLDTRLEERGSSETRELARSFNQMTEDLKNERARLIQAERMGAWRDVARRLAHEIGNVLSPIQLAVDSMRRARETQPGRLPELVDASGRVVSQELERLRRLVREFSTFARAPAPRPVHTDVNRLIEDTVSLEHATFREVWCRLDPAAGDAELDPEAVRAALINLIRNAVEAGASRVIVATRGGGEEVVVEVADNGPGIAELDRERIFKPYVSGREGGTGLGLAVVMRTATAHGGRVELDSTPGEGSRFRMILPRRFAGEPIAQPEAAGGGSPGGAGAGPEPGSAERPNGRSA